MQIPEMNIGTAVQVDWVDSKSDLGWSYNPKRKRTPGKIRSLGYVIQINDEAIAITTSMDDNYAGFDDLTIPLGCITNLEALPVEWSHDGPAPPPLERKENG